MKYISALFLVSGVLSAGVSESGSVLWTEEDLPYQTVAPGVLHADLWGDAKVGEHGSMARIAAGRMTPMHYHSHPAKMIILKGTWLYGEEGQELRRFPPGSYLNIPARVAHVSGCFQEAECQFFEEQPGKYDIHFLR